MISRTKMWSGILAISLGWIGLFLAIRALTGYWNTEWLGVTGIPIALYLIFTLCGGDPRFFWGTSLGWKVHALNGFNMVVLMGVIGLYIWLDSRGFEASWIKPLFVALVALGIAFSVALMVDQTVRGLDEMQRGIIVGAMAFAGLATVMTAVVIDFAGIRMHVSSSVWIIGYYFAAGLVWNIERG